MSLPVGAQLGPYEILGALGVGGMGEVYRAHDAKLDRDVALKVLPEAFATDPDRLTRLRREAQVLASLNHPNIGQIYGFEDSGGSHALVLELVDGPTLADLINTQRLSLAQALPIARQIVEALEFAHEHGIMHRDLKPANVKVRDDGAVKVLDFGLAKALDPSSSSSAEAMNSPTMTADATQVGVILGTIAYMAPEHARGRTVDKRADIWAFGAVFYEMLTGQRAFKGGDPAETLAAVLRQDIDWSALPVSTPVPIRQLLSRCLDRDAKTRLRDIGEARIVLAGPDVANATSTPTPQSGRRWMAWATAAAVAIIAGVGWWGWLHVLRGPPGTVTRSTISLPSFALNPVLSRDGTRLAYTSISGNQSSIWLRMMDQLESKLVPDSESGTSPVFSPDGQWLAYFSGTLPSKLKKIPVKGGTAVTVCDAPDAGIASWGDDDMLIFGSTKGLMRVAAAGGTPERLTTINTTDEEKGHGYPQVLPGGQGILFTIFTSSINSARIAVLDLKSRVYRVMMNSGLEAQYVPTGHLVYIRGGTLFAVPFDLNGLVVTGSETAVVEGIDLGGYTFSASGLLVFRAGSGTERSMTTLAWTNREGVPQALPEAPHAWGMVAVSPDGSRVAGAIWTGPEAPDGEHSDIWIHDPARRTLQRLTFEGSNLAPIWTPDGRWVTYGFGRAGKHAIYRVPADASGPPELLLDAESDVSPLSWTPDGKSLLYEQEGQHSDIWVLTGPNPETRKPRPFLRTVFNEKSAQIAPDGNWVAYSSNESGRDEIYVVPFMGPGPKVQISTQGGTTPQWAHNGRELFYVNSTSQVIAVDVETTPSFRAGLTRPLFKLSSGNSVWQVTPDPQRFLVERVPEHGSNTTFVLMTDWFEELRRRAPMK